ncbi:hypothetical protein J7E70_01875 [Variovorax paradoxus]|nr:hypothetical protein [Variovorax paradoxus]MBT2299203.1 hypothetical protein [Variovorax paradoxus]
MSEPTDLEMPLHPDPHAWTWTDAEKRVILAWGESIRAHRTEPAAPEPPFGSKRAAALALYKAPFHFIHGYIYDANHKMVADQDGFEGAVHEHVAARVRGWGRIGYMPDAAALQDEVGAVLADALTAFWSAQPSTAAVPEGVPELESLETGERDAR